LAASGRTRVLSVKAVMTTIDVDRAKIKRQVIVVIAGRNYRELRWSSPRNDHISVCIAYVPRDGSGKHGPRLNISTFGIDVLVDTHMDFSPGGHHRRVLRKCSNGKQERGRYG